MIVSASSLCVRFGAEEVFDDVTFNINRGERTALVGVNGAGKTTLFRLLSGELEPSEGELHIPEGTTVQCLQQQMSNFPEGPLQKTVCRQAGRAAQALRKMEKVSRKLEHAEGDSEKKKLLKSLAGAQDLADSTEAFSLKSRSERVLAGLGFRMDEFEKPLEDFSGGWRMRARLASLLLSDPDLLLLDEPTNHLDLDARIWLEEYLSSFGGAVWIISHDPGFLDRVVKNVCELEFGKLTCYSGNYSFYSRAKQEEVRRREKMARHQAEQIEKIQRFIKRFKATESKRFQVRSREKMLEKMEIIQTHRDPSHIKLRFPEPPRSGKIAARLEDAGKAYDKTVFEDVGLEILRGDRIGIVGKNGQGKSTLARVLAGTEELSSGTLKIGANVETGFYSQEADRSMEPELNLLDQLFAVSPDGSEGELRSILGAFLFTGDDVFKKTRVLSGGEKSRLALASILLKPVNLLILDEPTNHLDMFSRDVLCEALKGYTGTLVLISHDEKLLSATVNKVFEVGVGEVKPFHGTFDYYLRKKQEKIREEFGRGDDSGSEKSSPRENRKEKKRQEAAQRKKKYKKRQKLQKRLDRIEGKLMPLEEKASELEKMLADPEVLSSSSRLVKLQKEHAYLSQKIQEYRDMWDEIAEGMEDI